MATTLALHKHLAETQKDERLLAVVYVKSIKRGPQQGHKSLLCLTINNKTDVVTLQKLKVQQNDEFSTRQRWSLGDLKHVDAMGGKDLPNPTNRQFVLTFEKPVRWQAFSVKEKDAFLFVLWRSCGRYLSRSPTFENFDTQAFTGEAAAEEEEEHGTDGGRAMMQSPSNVSLNLGVDDKTGDVIAEDKELTAQQEQDIDEVLAHRDWSQSDAEEYSTRLAASLAGLELENIDAVLASDRKAAMLIKDIDNALKALDDVDEKIKRFDAIIFDVRTDVTEVDEQVKVVDAQATNEAALIAELEGLTELIRFPRDYREALLNGDLSNTMVLAVCADAVASLHAKRTAKLSPGLSEMVAVRNAMKEWKGLEDHFAARFEQFFVRYLGEQMERSGAGVAHETRRRRLEPFGPLMRWLKQTEPPSRLSRHMGLCKSYATALSPVYLQELKDSCERCKAACGVKSKGGSGGKRDLDSRLQLDAAFAELLAVTIPPRAAEQEFCRAFFIAGANDNDEGDGGGAEDEAARQRALRSKTTSGSARELEVLVEEFQGLDTEILDLVTAMEKADPFVSLIAMARMQGAGMYPHSMLAPYLRSLRQGLKNKFDAFVVGWVKSVREAKTPVKKKIGILPITEKFANTIEHMEKVLERGDDGIVRYAADEAMLQMAQAVIETIDRIASEVKYREVVIFENCHILKDRLSRLKVECLRPFRESVAARYKTAMHNFVRYILGRPMEKLSAFFEKVERLIESGTAANEVGFKMAFSKQELRKVIALYPGKEVRKGLADMYKKVDRVLSEDAYLLDVVWRNLQNEFVKQYQRFDELIAKCYPGEKVSLEFDVNDLLSYFTSIARST